MPMTELLSAGRGKGGRCPRIPVFDSSAIGSFTPLRAQSPESDYRSTSLLGSPDAGFCDIHNLAELAPPGSVDTCPYVVRR